MKEKAQPPRVDPVSKLEVSLSVLLAERGFSLDQILELSPGRILDFGRSHQSPLELHIDGSPVGRGRAVDVGDRLGFLIQEMDPFSEAEPRRL